MKIAIVSSYNLECGIARFSEILYKNFSKENDVTVFELPRQELKKSFGATEAAGERFVDNLCRELKSFDAVTVQCEYSLFSDSIDVSISRIKRILAANSNSAITLHTVISRASSAETVFPSWFKWIVRPRSTALGYINDLKNAKIAKSELNLLQFIKKNNIKVIVHTETTKTILQQRFKIANVDCHPLCYTTEEEKKEFNHLECRNELANKLDLDESSKIIGVFGFFGWYKGFDFAIRCLARLPEDYKLLIFSGLHPNSIKGSDNSQIDYLIDLAKKNKVLGRTYFMGSVDDAAMYRAIAGVDVSWLPYREVGQEASAICSEVAELSQRMLVSRNFAFLDYMKFKMRDNFEFFEIGNIEELRIKTINYDRYHPTNNVPTTVDHATLQTNFYLNFLAKPAN